MLYIQEQTVADDELPPMAGTRIINDVVDEDVLVVRIQHAKQSFRSGRREDYIVMAMRDPTDDEIQQKCMDQLHVEIGKRPLIS